MTTTVFVCAPTVAFGFETTFLATDFVLDLFPVFTLEFATTFFLGAEVFTVALAVGNGFWDNFEGAPAGTGFDDALVTSFC